MTQAETRKLNLRVPSSEEARINGRKGGIASGKARAAKKTFKEMAMSLPETERKLLFDALISKAKDGSLPHLELYLEMCGEHPQQDMSIDKTINITIGGESNYGD